VEAAAVAQLLLPAYEFLELVLAAQFKVIDLVLGDNDELRAVNGIDAFAKNSALPAALAAKLVLAGLEEALGVLKVRTFDDAGEGLARLKRVAVAGVNVADFSLRDGDQR